MIPPGYNWDNAFRHGGTTYSLTFTRPGVNVYWELSVSGMRGVVVVHPAGTPYPFTQAQYSKQARQQLKADLAAGKRAKESLRPVTTATRADGTHRYHVVLGTNPPERAALALAPASGSGVRGHARLNEPGAGSSPNPAITVRIRLSGLVPGSVHAMQILPGVCGAPAPAAAGALAERAAVIRAALRSPQLAQPSQVTAAGAAVVRALTAVITTLNQQIKALERQVEAHFRAHPDAEIILSQPGLGPVLGARVLAEFGDDPTRYAPAKARKNYAATSPITRQSGKKKTVMARYVRNGRLRDALGRQAYSALTASAGARAYYDQLRARNIAHDAALRQLANRLVGILHGCLKTRTPYNEATAWPHHANDQFPTAA